MTYALGLGAGRPRPAGLIALSGFMPTVADFELDIDAALPALRDRARSARPGDLRRLEPRRANAPRGSRRRRHVPRVPAHGPLDRSRHSSASCRHGSPRRCASPRDALDRRGDARHGPDGRVRRRVRERRSGARGRRNVERVHRMARADARATPARARLRGGALPGEVVAAPRVVRRGCTRGSGRGRRAARRPARVLDGRRSLRRDRQRARGRGGRGPRAVDPGSARRQHAPTQAAHRLPRRPRPLAPGNPGRVRVALEEGLRPRPRARGRGPLRPHPRRAPRHRAALAVGKARQAAESRPLGRARRGGAPRFVSSRSAADGDEPAGLPTAS